MVAEPLAPSVEYGRNEALQHDEDPEALESAEIQRLLSRSSSPLADGQEDETLPAPETVPSVVYAGGAPAGDGEQTHLVTEGETLWDIALRYGLSLEDVAARNGLASDARIAAGDTLVIRPIAASPQQP